MRVWLKFLFIFINFNIFNFTFCTTRFIFQNINNNLIYLDIYSKYCYYINQDFLYNKIRYYKECYNYSKNCPVDVTFNEEDKENAKNHLIIAFCEIKEEEKDRIGKKLQELNYKIEFDINAVYNENNIDDIIFSEDNKESINKNNLKFELIINNKGVILNYINKINKNIFKTEKIDNKKWALFELKTKDDEFEIDSIKYKIEKSTKYLFVSDINSQQIFKECFKKNEDKNNMYKNYYGLFQFTHNYNINVIFCNTENITNFIAFFKNDKLENVENFELIDTQNVKNMNSSFYSKKLKSINLYNLNTTNVENMSNIFCEINLKKIEFGPNFKTDNVKDISVAFFMSNIEEIDLSKLNFENVEKINSIFSYCQNLEKVNMSNLNLKKIKSLYQAFIKCKKLKEINFNGIKFENLIDIEDMFAGCESLKKIDLSFLKKNSTNESLDLQYIAGLFDTCTNLEEIIFGDNFDTSNITSMNFMFSKCTNLKKLDLTKFNTQKVTQMIGMFKESNFKELILPNNFIPKNCKTENNAKSQIFENTNIETFKIGDKTLDDNSREYESFAKCPKLYLTNEDNLNSYETVSIKCTNCCSKSCSKCCYKCLFFSSVS